MAYEAEAPMVPAIEPGPMGATLSFLQSWDGAGLDVTFDIEDRSISSWWNHKERPSMTPDVMRSCDALYAGLQQCSWAGDDWFRYYVMRSGHGKIWSYGGDFSLLLDTIERKDAEKLRRYGEVCIQAIHKVISGVGERMISIAAVDGTCLGGGLEGALAADFIVAERSAKLGLPEANIGMFPGAGAYSMLVRKIGPRETERLITAGAYFTAEEGYELGIVDELCEDGEIEKGLKALKERITPRFNTYLTTVRARRRVTPITLDEMRGVIDDWVDAAMTMEPHHLMLMRHLLTRQNRNAQRYAANEEATVSSLHGTAPAQKANPFRTPA
ncbi:crotonase/enoyl-CoA hydratase family protein [Parvularcula dongshanensis]|uniref:DSF synthase n=1 Tax=Parvularcula dongshanensis TaxID=1173995 RepID=A0A840I5E2_9PROT|nr:crotonase/enoyl-CoA hydratase family protein [Parvularcula dongshanensis]MBB4659240.1 DSF synthase [Parvularcula dongshanensis]